MHIAPLKAIRSTGLVLVTLTALSSSAAAMGPGCPCMVAGGPPGDLAAPVARVAIVSSPATQPGANFDWPDAGVGAGFTLAIGLLGLGGAAVLRRPRRTHVSA